MKKMQVMVIKYGYATLEVDSEEEALGKTKNMKERKIYETQTLRILET